MLDEGVQPNETTVPILPCVAPEEALAFWRALGFAVTYELTKPYLYLAFRWCGFELPTGAHPATQTPSLENTGGYLGPIRVSFHPAPRALRRELAQPPNPSGTSADDVAAKEHRTIMAI